MAKSLKPKSLCKFSKHEIDEHFTELTRVTHSGKFLCTKCARSAQDKKWLCKPKNTH